MLNKIDLAEKCWPQNALCNLMKKKKKENITTLKVWFLWVNRP